MTREVAIDILKCGRPFDDNPKADLDDFNLALGVAIKEIKNENDLIDRVLEIIDNATADYEAVPTEIDVGREKAVISFEKKDGMLAMASMIRTLVLGLRGEE